MDFYGDGGDNDDESTMMLEAGTAAPSVSKVTRKTGKIRIATRKPVNEDAVTKWWWASLALCGAMLVVGIVELAVGIPLNNQVLTFELPGAVFTTISSAWIAAAVALVDAIFWLLVVVYAESYYNFVNSNQTSPMRWLVRVVTRSLVFFVCSAFAFGNETTLAATVAFTVAYAGMYAACAAVENKRVKLVIKPTNKNPTMAETARYMSWLVVAWFIHFVLWAMLFYYAFPTTDSINTYAMYKTGLLISMFVLITGEQLVLLFSVTNWIGTKKEDYVNFMYAYWAFDFVIIFVFCMIIIIGVPVAANAA